ncbi:MAG TPA: DEAD/DEAH box helicase, partial [Kofleriaceae bacterium]
MAKVASMAQAAKAALLAKAQAELAADDGRPAEEELDQVVNGKAPDDDGDREDEDEGGGDEGQDEATDETEREDGIGVGDGPGAVEGGDGVAAAAPAPKRRGRKPAPLPFTEPLPPPRAAYMLDGPIPPEGAGLPDKVGRLLGIAQQALGLKTFRPGQAEAFEHLLEGKDLLAVMPTGSGKSLLYQLTSLVVEGVTVVVSPLIALIKDQLDKMVAKGVAACKIDSTLTVKQRREVDAL